MPQNATGGVTLLVLLLTFTLNSLFGILIARACWRAYTLHSTDEYLHIVYLNDSLERIRNVVIHEILSWASI